VDAEPAAWHTNEDKRKAVLTLLNDAEWTAWADREIARICGVGHQMVAPIRSSLVVTTSERTYTTRHGTTATMNVENIGKRRQVTVRIS